MIFLSMVAFTGEPLILISPLPSARKRRETIISSSPSMPISASSENTGLSPASRKHAETKHSLSPCPYHAFIRFGAQREIDAVQQHRFACTRFARKDVESLAEFYFRAVDQRDIFYRKSVQHTLTSKTHSVSPRRYWLVRGFPLRSKECRRPRWILRSPENSVYPRSCPHCCRCRAAS